MVFQLFDVLIDPKLGPVEVNLLVGRQFLFHLQPPPLLQNLFDELAVVPLGHVNLDLRVCAKLLLLNKQVVGKIDLVEKFQVLRDPAV